MAEQSRTDDGVVVDLAGIDAPQPGDPHDVGLAA
jgi:hypothetical protein